MAVETMQGVVTWMEDNRTLTLTGEPVLELSLTWPKLEGKRMGRAAGYYARLQKVWKKHWEREGYWQACADLARQREQSRPFRVWRAELSGQVMLDRRGYLSIAMQARETRGDGRVLAYRWGDTWRWEDGSIVTLHELLAQKGWKKRLEQELLQAAQICRQKGVYLDERLQPNLRRWCSGQRFALSEEGMEFYYPQCTIAPAVEEVVTICIPMHTGIWTAQEEKDA